MNRAAVAALALCATACGYHLSGTTSTLPQDVQRFVVLPFDNRSTRPEIEQRVTERVATELSRRNRSYRVVSDVLAADAVLSGAITSYRTHAVQFNAEGRATRVEAVVQIQAALRRTVTDEVLWSQGGLLFREQFDVPDTGEYFDQETLALDEIASGAAAALISSLFEGF